MLSSSIIKGRQTRLLCTKLFRLSHRHDKLAGMVEKVCLRSLSTAAAVDHYNEYNHPHHHHHHRHHHQSMQQKRHQDAMRHVLQQHGYQLANVNPIRADGLLLDPSCVKRCIPPSMATLLEILTEMRRNEASGNSCDFAHVLHDRFLQNEHVTIHHEDAESLEALVNSYCNHIGFEFQHCNTEAERQFFVSVIEDTDRVLANAGMKEFNDLWIFKQLYAAEMFEKLLHERYSNARTFGIEGMESATLALNALVEAFACATENQDSHVLLGTTHRGRLNYVANCLKTPWQDLIARWDETGGPTYDDVCGGLGLGEKDTSNHCQIFMIPIPAHLEAMGPTLLGKARAHATELARGNEPSTDKLATHLVLPISLHGDSSFCGQGVIQETLQLSTCKHYECGGTIHFILNNQVGFTTELSSIRGERFQSCISSDIMKSIGAPILHVNAQKPKAVVRASQIALLYRQLFGGDILIDLIGWRKRGHSELDDPTMTNVMLYNTIRELESVTNAYKRELERSLGNTAEAEIMRATKDIDQMYLEAKKIRRDASAQDQLEKRADDGALAKVMARPANTSITRDILEAASAPLITVPDGFHLHPIVERAVNARRKMLSGNIDWALAELLALSSLATEGIPVRLSGEDSERGTFSSRHAVWHDVTTGEPHSALPQLMEVTNSPLSEFGVVGFEFGWSLCIPKSLTLWEAQFGDFSNEAQVVFDTILSSSASKWNLESQLVLLLPHGYDGMGPEHSSCRPERWLQMFALEKGNNDDDGLNGIYEACNFVVACPTEPANYFHLLRRQLTWPFRRPLIVMTPKRTLRSPHAVSPISDILSDGTQDQFTCVLDDPHCTDHKENIKKMILCSGELYYDLLKLREHEESLANVAFVRLEQLAPFPSQQLDAIIQSYPRVKCAAWVQEDPANSGAASFIRKQVLYEQTVPGLIGIPMKWISRPEAHAVADGHPHKYAASQRQLLQDVLAWSESS